LCGTPVPVHANGQITKITADESSALMSVNSNSSFSLESRRDGSSDGRVYTVFYNIADSFGDVAPGQCKFQVPHSQNGTPAVDSGEQSCIGTCP
jgi:hypothetical protein